MARLLLVEDEATLGVTLQEGLERAQHTVDLAQDGEDALDYVRVGSYDVIVLDVMLPKLDGFGVCRQLRADPSLPFIPIILITARTDPRDVVAGLEAGGDEYLIKPVDQVALLARVKSVLRIKNLHDTAQGLAAKCWKAAPRTSSPWSRSARGRKAPAR